MYFARVGSLTICRSPSRSDVSHNSRPSTLSLAECVSHGMLCTFKSPNTKTPTAPFLCLRYSTSKLLMVSTFPGLGGRYQQHIRYGPRSECTITHMRSATSDSRPASLWEHIRAARTLKLSFPIGLLDRAERVADSLPALRFRLPCSRMCRLMRQGNAFPPYFATMQLFRRYGTSSLAG